jgi:glycosyltransferase involved in cell wall biosynthesis
MGDPAFRATRPRIKSQLGLQRRPKLLIVVNVDWFFVSHRLAIAEAAIREGYEVHIACAFTDFRSFLEAKGLVTHQISLTRGRAGVFADLKSLRHMYELMRAEQPDLVHLVTIKPVLIGGLAARLAGVRSIVAAVSGLGYVFIAKGMAAYFRRLAARTLYAASLKGSAVTVIFQNPDDCRLVSAIASLKPRQVEMIPGSGVDLEIYRNIPPPSGETTFIFAARLLLDKGLREFVEAAALLRRQGLRARFIVAGERDGENAAAVSSRELQRWEQDGNVEFVGHQSDVPGLFAHAHVVVLPSYREGMPKVLLEAAACGRAVITTDVPGCRDAVIPNETALVVPPRSTGHLAAAMQKLIEDRDFCECLGKRGRVLAESRFSLESVVDRHLAIYRRLSGPG